MILIKLMVRSELSDTPAIINPVLQIANTLSNPYLRNIVKADFIGALIQSHKNERAIQLLEEILRELPQIESDSQKTEVLCTVATTFAKIKIPEAEQLLEKVISVTEHITDPYYLVEVYIHTVASLSCNEKPERAKTLFNETLEKLKDIKPIKKRLITLCKWPVIFSGIILKLEPDTVDKLKGIPEEFTSPHKIRAYRCIAELLLRIGQIDIAETLSEQITEDEEKNAFLRELAKTLIERNEYTHAVQIIEAISNENDKASVLRKWAQKIISSREGE